MRQPKLRALWGALLSSQVVFLQVPFIAAPTGHAASPSAVSRLFLILAAVSAATAVGTIVYRRRALVAPIQGGQLDPDTREGSARAFTALVLNWVLTNTISVYGLVLAIYSQEPRLGLPFGFVALGLMYFHRPMARALAPHRPSGAYRPPPLA